MPRKALTDDERAKRRQADRDKAREAVDALKASDGWQRWLSTRRHFHRYSLANQLLIAHQCPHATRVAGFRAWLKLGYCVAQGQAAIRIWVPMAPSKAQLERWRAAGSNPDDRPRTHFRLGPVFDRNQVQELPPPAQPVGLDPPITNIDGDTLTHLNQPLRRLAADLGSLVELETMPAQRHGYYEPESKRIALNDTLSVNAQIKTLIHELAHALTRSDRLDEDPELSYAEEELVAECVAYTVCGTAGLDVAGYAIPYLASWSEAASIDTIEQGARLIDRLARRIETAIEATGKAGDEGDLVAEAAAVKPVEEQLVAVG